MPGCLFYFCAEWQRARRVLLPTSDILQELLDTLGPDGELHESLAIVEEQGLKGWQLDLNEAVEAGLLPSPTSRASTLALRASSRLDCRDLVADGCPLVSSSTATSAMVSPRSGGPRRGWEKSPRLGSLTVGALLHTATPRSVGRAILPAQNYMRRKFSPPQTPRAAAAPNSRPKHTSATVSPRSPSPSAASPSPGPGPGTGTLATRPMTFLNPAHPLAGLHGPLTREEFVHELRRRLRVERLLSPGATERAPAEPLLSTEEAEDLFEALVLLQNPGEGGVTLETGKRLDIAVEQFFALHRLRKIIETSSPSLAAFFRSLDLDDNGFVETAELQHFLKHDGSGASAALAAGGFQHLLSGSLSSIFMSMLDADGDGYVQLWELRRQMALVAEPRVPPVLLLGHFEMKHGVGRVAQAKLAYPAGRAQLFNHLCQEELLDLSPEDTVRTFRVWQAGGSDAPPGDRERGKNHRDSAYVGESGGTLTRSNFEHALERLPLETAWAVEPHAADRLYSALGVRVLQLERGRRLDSCLPPEAVLEALDDNILPEVSELRGRFDRLWSRCVGEKGLWRCLGPHNSSDTAAAELREGCFARYLEAAKKVIEMRSSSGDEMAAMRVDLGPRSLFANVGDVLATVTSARVQSGRPCIIRYRLMGSSNFWHPEHQVLKDEREVIPWPVPRKVLGETPFVGIVPCGLRWTSAGGGGFYLGTQSFTQVDPSLRADLPRDAETGLPLLFGHVEIIAPFLLRSAQNRGSDGQGCVEEFELRLFCSRKNRIIGCIGEPLRVRVEHQTLPSPLATLQLNCEGARAALRWSALNLGPYCPPSVAESVQLHMRSSHSEQTHCLHPGTEEWEVADLAPDTEYEFRVRLVNRVGSGREAVATCRTNARCSAPPGLSNPSASARQVELRWGPLEVVGNEVTRDRFQARPEALERFEAELRVEVPPRAGGLEGVGAGGSRPASASRACRWPSGSWHKDLDGSLVTQLGGLEPDTHYSLEGFRAVNSMGAGLPSKPLKFWTTPLPPQVVHVRVRQGLVLVALIETGGDFVQEYNLSVSLIGQHPSSRSYSLPRSRLRDPADSRKEPELLLDFKQMPVAMEFHEEHSFQLRARNLGGWSGWSEHFKTVAIARQQGADQAQAALVEAIEARDIDQLGRVLQEVRDIEFSDERYLHQATSLLQRLQEARQALAEAMEACDPAQLERALRSAEEVQLPDREEAASLLQALQEVVQRLETAKGIEELRWALKAGHEARLPPSILQEAVERLGTREAAQQGLELAMEAARVPVLSAALATAKGMHLPSEEAASALLEALSCSEGLLSAAIESALLHDLATALKDAAASGLREEGLIREATDLHLRLLQEQSAAQERLQEAVARRFPEELRAALQAATAAQVPQESVQSAEQLLSELERLLLQVHSAVGVTARKTALREAHGAAIPAALLGQAERQLELLEGLLRAQEEVDLGAMRRYLRLAVRSKVSLEETRSPQQAFQEWSLLARELELCLSMRQTEDVRSVLAKASASGFKESHLREAVSTLQALERRDLGERGLREALAARRSETLQRALRLACEVGVGDQTLIARAREVLAGLLQRRLGLEKAVEARELPRLYQALERARAPPSEALPEEELLSGGSSLEAAAYAASAATASSAATGGAAAEAERLQAGPGHQAQRLLLELQEEELQGLRRLCLSASRAQDFRALDALVQRGRQLARLGVQSESLGLEALEQQAAEWHSGLQARLEHELYLERECEEPPTSISASHNPQRLEPEAPEEQSSGPTAIEPRATVELPSRTISGELRLAFTEVGVKLAVLPAQVVQCTLSAAVADSPDEPGLRDVAAAEAACEEVLALMPLAIDEADSICRLSPYIVEDDGVHRRVDLRLSIHLRGSRDAAEVVGTLHQSGLSGLTSGPDARAAETAIGITECDVAVLERLQHSLCLCSAGGEAPRHVHLGLGCLQDVRGHDLHRVTLSVAWLCPGLMQEPLDAACIAFSFDHLVEVVDVQGSHGPQYGANVQAIWLDQRNLDGVFGAVQSIASLSDVQARTGKQQILVRLDLLPLYVSDLVFVLTSRNTSELSKYDALEATISDTDTGEVFASFKLDSPDARAEAVVTIVMSRGASGLWHACGVNSKSRGNMRNYRPVLERLLELGFPRQSSMQRRVPAIFNAMQQKLALPHQLKCSGMVADEKQSLHVGYVFEIFSSDMTKSFSEVVQQLVSPELQHQVMGMICDPMGGRFTGAKLELSPARVRPVQRMTAEMCWELKPEDRADSKEGASLHGVCVAFAGTALAEVLDYKGAHGVRIVHNGILDSAGVWLGRMGIGDATDGAVQHVAETLDSTACVGFEIDAVRLPSHVSDLYFVLCAPIGQNLGCCARCSLRLRDSECLGHELALMGAAVQDSEALILGHLSREDGGVLRLRAPGLPSHGGAADYRPLLGRLRQLQLMQLQQQQQLHRAAGAAQASHASGMLLPEAC